MKRIFFFSILLLGGLLPATAQDRTTLGIQYQYALPMGGLKNDFIDKGSARGLSVDILYTINPQWRVGGAFAYQDFYQKNPRETYQLPDGSHMSAVISNSLQTSALMAKGMFLPRGTDSSRLQPYISAGAGVNMLQYSQSYGEFSNGDDVNIRMALQGGAGLMYTVGEKRRTSFTFGAVYNYMPLNQFEIKNANNIAIQAGVRFTLSNDNRGGGRRGNDDYYQRQPNHYRRGGYYGW